MIALIRACVGSRSVLLAGVVTAGLASILASGGTGGSPPPPAPAAVKPIVNKVHSSQQDYQPYPLSSNCGDHRFLVSTFALGSQLVLFMTNLPQPSDVQLAVDETILSRVASNMPFNGPGFKVNITGNEWRVLVNPDRPAPLVLRVRNVSQNPALLGKDKTSDAVEVRIATTGPLVFCGPKFQARGVPGGWIAFTSNRTGQNKVWAVPGDESWDAYPLHQATGGGGDHPLISPPDADGAWISIGPESALIRPPETDAAYLTNDAWLWVDAKDIWSATYNPPGVKHLTNAHADSSPNVSADGKKIAFLRANKVHVMNADGSSMKNLVGFIYPDPERSPVLSPDGTMVAFLRSGQLWVVPVTNVPTPTSMGTSLGTSGILTGRPTWRPDGRFIAIEAGPTAAQRDIFVVDVSTKQWEQVTTGGNNFTPAWCPVSFSSSAADSPIAFVSTRDVNREIYVVNADRTGLRNVSNSPAEDFDVVWR